MKVCGKCGAERELSEFHRDRSRKDGLHPYCKVCQNKKAAEWCRSNRERANENARRYRKSNPERWKQIAQTYMRKYPEKIRAHWIANDALRRGLIKRATKCSKCGKKPKRGILEKHHEDYSKPLDIRWLCKMCHDKADAERRVENEPRPELSLHPSDPPGVGHDGDEPSKPELG